MYIRTITFIGRNILPSDVKYEIFNEFEYLWKRILFWVEIFLHACSSLKADAKVLAQISSSIAKQRYMLQFEVFFYLTEQTELYLTTCFFLYFWIRMSFKNAESEEFDKTVVTFYKNEGNEVLKHTVNYFKERNIPVRTIYNIVAKYRKRNSTSYLPKGGRRKRISDQ